MRGIVRVLAFARKEVVDVARQPRLVLALVAGPFLILLIFGAGLRDADPPQRVLIVTPPDESIRERVEEFAASEEEQETLEVAGITTDRDAALERLAGDEVDVVLVFPDEVAERVQQDEQATIVLYHAQIDPIEQQALTLFAGNAVDEINTQMLEEIVAQSQGDAEDLQSRVARARERTRSLEEARATDDQAAIARETDLLRSDLELLARGLGPSLALLGAFGSDAPTGEGGDESRPSVPVGVLDEGDPTEEDLVELDQELARLEEQLQEFESLSPSVLARPFDAEIRLVATESTELTEFYAPAAVVVLVQHLVVTFLALSVVRERDLGTTELFRVAPVRTTELVTGKYLAYLLLGAVVATVLLVLCMVGLGVPMNGAWPDLAAGVAVLLLASTALGLVVAYLARSDSQAVQFSMLVLLATIFLSGFLLSLERFLPFAQPVAWLLPATYGNELVRTVMLRGAPAEVQLLGAAVGYAVVLTIVGTLLARREMRAPT